MLSLVKKPPPTLNPALRDFWLTQADTKVLKGGRASTKTWDAAGFAIYLASNFTLKFLCMRQFQNKIAESVYAVLIVQINRFGLQNEFEVLKTVIRHRTTGSSFHFYGIHRDIAEIKGFEDADIGWIEEGEGLTKDQWVVIEPTLRNDCAECWILYNPRLVSDFVEKFVHDPDNGIIVRHINYDENQFLSKTMQRKIARMKEADPDEYEHIYLGVAKTDDDEVVIKRSWIEAAIDAHLVLDIPIAGSKRSGFDVADSGKDLCSHIWGQGIVALGGEHWKAGEDELLQSCTRVYNKAVVFGSHVNYDSIGVGALAGSKFSDINAERKENGLNGKITYSKFVAGAKVVDPDAFYIEPSYDDSDDKGITNHDFFKNLKAQAWWTVADRFRNTYNAVHAAKNGDANPEKFEIEDLISISSDMDNLANLVTELSTPRRKFAKDGRVKVEDKDDLAAREVDSPNDADAFIMLYAPTEINVMGDLLKMAMGKNR